ncbi:hypothetical protein M0805_009468 [Coniferiporia weirii]|nr:hypothetical protein M0805_009468 [Coniferiporia weirii]
MGGRRKRRRSKKSRDTTNNGLVALRASRRVSASFMSPGDLGELVIDTKSAAAAHPFAFAYTAGVTENEGRRDRDLGTGTGVGRAQSAQAQKTQFRDSRSPEIQIEFKHGSLMKSLPEEFKYRKGSAPSSADEAIAFVRPPLSNASASASTLEGSPRDRDQKPTAARDKVTRLKPVVKPIQIPTLPLLPKGVSEQHLRQPADRKRRSRPASRRLSSPHPHSPAWASDSELDPNSAISGTSAARDVLLKSFSFSARTPGLQFGFGDPPVRERRDTDGDGDAGEREGEERAMMMRQDSATLPRDAVWEGTTKSPATISRKSSAHSISRRRRIAAAVAAAAAVAEPPLPSIKASDISASASAREPRVTQKTKKGEEPEKEEKRPVPPRKDSVFRPRPRNAGVGHPPPPVMNPSSQKLGYEEQVALHRISRITEGDVEGSSVGTGSPPPPLSGSSSREPLGRVRSGSAGLGSPAATPSVAASSPSKYSKYSSSSSPNPSPGNMSMSGVPSSRTTDYDQESFLDDFQFTSPGSGSQQHSQSSSPPVKSRRQAGYSVGPFSPFGMGVPMTAASTASGSMSPSMSVLGSGSGMGSPGFLYASARSSPAPARQFSPNSNSNSNAGSSSSPSSRAPHSDVSAKGSARSNDPGSAHSSPLAGSSSPNLSFRPQRSRNGSVTSMASGAVNSPTSSVRNKAVPLNVIAAKNSLSTNKDVAPIQITRLPIGNGNAQDVRSSQPGTPDSEKRRPSLPQLRVNSVVLPSSAVSSSVTPLDPSPDLLDMLIPDGHVVTPISHSRRQLGHKRSGSTPSPIKIVSIPQRYSPLNGDDTIPEVDDIGSAGRAVGSSGGGRDNNDNTPSTAEYAYAHTQTFPETPVLFSPEFSAEMSLPMRNSRPISRSMSATSLRMLAYAHSSQRAQHHPPPPMPRPIVIPSTPQVPTSAKTMQEGVGGRTKERETKRETKRETVRSSVSSSSPLVSPLQPFPPEPLVSLVAPPEPHVQILPKPKPQAQVHVQVPSESRPSTPPILAPAPPKKIVRMRPPLPFGPRKPSNPPSLGQGPGTAPLTFAPRRKVASESSAGLSRFTGSGSRRTTGRDEDGVEAPLGTPTFKTTPVRWRGLTLDAAKWTFSSSQLQNIVRDAIEQSSQASSIRLLSEEVLENEIPQVLGSLEARRVEIQSNYKVLVRRRRALVQRLTTPQSNASVILRVAEELAEVTGACDKLVEELHDVCDQIAQILRLKDVHLASALSMALRKINASLCRRTGELRALQVEATNLHSEREEAWRKAEEVERELIALNEQITAAAAASSSSTGTEPRSTTSSNRSSRVSVSVARRGSARVSKAGLRLSGFAYRSSSRRSSRSSMHVNLSSSVRTTFSSDAVPPVPPLPSLNSATLNADQTASASHGIPTTSSGLSTGGPNTADGLFHDLYNLLDRSAPYSTRPHSIGYRTPPPALSPEDGYGHGRFGQMAAASNSETVLNLRRVSLQAPRRELYDQDTDAIIAMLDFQD